MHELSDLHRAKRGVAILATCIVETLNESDPTFKDRFLTTLERAYRKLKDDSEGDVSEEMSLVLWTHEHLTGWNAVTGRGKPFFEG